MNKYTNDDHCFALCAYKENPYLEECIKSLINQSLKTNIVIVTATPNKYIKSLADKYNISIIINNEKETAGRNFNYAIEHVNHKLITICHQDDIYYKDYAKLILDYANKANDPIIIYTNCSEIRNNKIVNNNIVLNTKRLLNRPLINKKNWSNIKKRKRMLSFGNSISCPTVTFVKNKVGKNPFDESLICSGDYKAWINLSSIKGDFIYIPIVLLAHRIHKDSGTTTTIQNKLRAKEDAKILSELWPFPINKIIYSFYSIAQKNNNF